MVYFKWFIQFWFVALLELIGWATNWFVCLFVTHKTRTDRVKRIDNLDHTMLREYPVWLFTLWSTHDNAMDEYWWGKFGDEDWSVEEYQDSWWKRYVCRVKWLYRNNMYGWLYLLFSQPVEPLLKQKTKGVEGKGYWYNLELYPSSFMLEAHWPIKDSKYYSVKIGWKSHKGFPNKMFANRFPPFGRKSYD